MTDIRRRHSLRVLGVWAITGGMLKSSWALAAPLTYPPEQGAQLKLLRWKRFVQGDEDVFLANTRRFTEKTGVTVQVESVNIEDLRPKGAMAANVGTGPDIVMGAVDMPQMYPDKCVDLTELATYLGQKYGGWYDVCHHYGTRDGRWIAAF